MGTVPGRIKSCNSPRTGRTAFRPTQKLIIVRAIQEEGGYTEEEAEESDSRKAAMSLAAARTKDGGEDFPKKLFFFLSRKLPFSRLSSPAPRRDACVCVETRLSSG